MPAKTFTFAGPGRRKYPELRDADGQIVGEVGRGDTRDFDREWPYTQAAKDAAEGPGGSHEGGEWPHPIQDEPEWWPAPDHDWFPAGQELPIRTVEDAQAAERAAAAAKAGAGSKPQGSGPNGGSGQQASAQRDTGASDQKAEAGQ